MITALICYSKYKLSRELKESRVGSIGLKALWRSNCAPVRIVSLHAGLIPAWMIEKVEHVRTQLEVIFAEYCEAFEEGHVVTVISWAVDRVGTSTQIRYRIVDSRNL